MPSWLLSCTFYLPRCNSLAMLHLDILCIVRTTPTTQPPIDPNQNLKVQLIEFTYCNDKFPRNPQQENYDTLTTVLTQLGWMVLPTIINIAGIKGSINTSTIPKLRYLKIPLNKIYGLIETF